MKNQRFIFTIDEATKRYIARVAKKDGISRARVVKNIIKESEKLDFVKDGNKGTEAWAEKGNIDFIEHYQTPDLSQILHNENFLEFLSNEDIDFLIYALDDYISSGNTNEASKIIYAKLLKHRGYLTQAISILNSIDNKYDVEKHLLLLSIYISIGDIPKANQQLLICTELLNLYNQQFSKYKGDYLVLKAEFIWINSGVIKAHDFVQKTLTNTKLFDDRITGKLHCLLGEFLRDKGSYREAKSSYNLALQYLKKYPYEGTYIVRALKGLGSIYKNQSEFKTSSQYIFNALETSKKFADKITESGVLASIGSLYLAQNKSDLGISMLQEKADIGKRAHSMREIFYANYDLGIANIEKGDFHKAQETLENSLEIGDKFKRRYYMDMWRGLVKSFENFDEGIKIIEKSKEDAIEAGEDKKVHQADYVLAAAYLNNPKQASHGKRILNELMNKMNISRQLLYNSEVLLKSSTSIRSI